MSAYGMAGAVCMADTITRMIASPNPYVAAFGYASIAAFALMDVAIILLPVILREKTGYPKEALPD